MSPQQDLWDLAQSDQITASVFQFYDNYQWTLFFLCIYNSTVFWTGAVNNNIEIKSNTFRLGCCWESVWRAPQQPCEDRKSHWKCQPQNQRVTIHCTTTIRDKNRKLQSVYLPVKDGNKIGFPSRNKLAHHVIFMYQKNGWL